MLHLTIMTEGVYWTTWRAPTMCHIQTVMTQMNRHGHGMHPIVLIKFFHFALHSYFITKKCQVFLTHPVYACIFVHMYTLLWLVGHLTGARHTWT
jgi:hypothetical protein